MQENKAKSGISPRHNRQDRFAAGRLQGGAKLRDATIYWGDILYSKAPIEVTHSINEGTLRLSPNTIEPNYLN